MPKGYPSGTWSETKIIGSCIGLLRSAEGEFESDWSNDEDRS